VSGTDPEQGGWHGCHALPFDFGTRPRAVIAAPNIAFAFGSQVEATLWEHRGHARVA